MQLTPNKEFITNIDYKSIPPISLTFLSSQVIYDAVNDILEEINYDEQGKEVSRFQINNEEDFEYITLTSDEYIDMMNDRIQIEEYDWGYIINELDEGGTITGQIKRVRHVNGMISKEEKYNRSCVLSTTDEWFYDDNKRIIGNKVVDYINYASTEVNLVYDQLDRLVTIHKKYLVDESLTSETIITQQYD